MASPFAASCKAAKNWLRAEEISEQEAKVGGALSEAPHEIREPIVAKRNVNAESIAVLHEAALQIGADAVEHLKLKVILGDLFGSGPANGFRDHARVVGSDAVVKTAGQENLHKSNVIKVDVPLGGVRYVRWFLISAFTKPDSAAAREQSLHVRFTSIKVGLDDRSDGGIA